MKHWICCWGFGCKPYRNTDTVRDNINMDLSEVGCHDGIVLESCLPEDIVLEVMNFRVVCDILGSRSGKYDFYRVGHHAV
jgi:hypothetical protein